ncbi:hypothetical protein BDD12DRAFT_834545 [Trichophaea hybrida]|nr:hypothetical protein BDD12DRAFT_834545 [Trichophaea hybrida]
MPRRKNLTKNLLHSTDGWSIVPGRNHTPASLPLKDQISQLSITGDYSHLVRALTNVTSDLATDPALSPLRRAVSTLKLDVERVLVLGLGNFEGVSGASTMLQLAMVLEIVNALSGEAEMEVIFRDPAFTGTDIAFLRERWKVEDVGTQDEEVEKGETVLVAPHLNFDVLKSHLECTKPPVLMVSNDLQRFMDLCIGDTQEWDVFLQFFTEDGEYNYKPIEVENRGEEGIGRAFNDLAVFWRKDAVGKG